VTREKKLTDSFRDLCKVRYCDGPQNVSSPPAATIEYLASTYKKKKKNEW
jgi:hypothetical protein